MISTKRVLFIYFLGILLYWYPAYLSGWAGAGRDEFFEIPLAYRVMRILWVFLFGFFITLIKGRALSYPRTSKSFLVLLFCFISINIIALIVHFDSIYELSSAVISSFSWVILIYIYLSLNKSFWQSIHEDLYSTLRWFVIIQIMAVIYQIFWGPVTPHDSGILRRGIGTLGEPSAFGIFSVFAAIMFFSRLVICKKRTSIKFFVFSMALLLSSVSISAIIGFLCGMIYLMLFYGNLKNKITFVLFTVAIPFFTVKFWDYLNEHLFFVKHLFLKVTSNIEGTAPPRLEIIDSVNYLLNQMSITDLLIGDFTGLAPAPENYYVFTFFKIGIIVFILLVVILCLTLRHGHSKAINAGNNKQYEKCAYYAGLTSFIIAISISNMAIPSLRIFVGSIIIWNAVLLVWFSSKSETYKGIASESGH